MLKEPKRKFFIAKLYENIERSPKKYLDHKK